MAGKGERRQVSVGSSILALLSPLSPTQVGPSPRHPTLIWPPCAGPAPEYTLPNDLSWAVRGSMGLPRPGPAGSCREVPNRSWRATKRTGWGGEEKPGWEQSREPGSGILLGTAPGRPGSPVVKSGGAPGWFPGLFAF